MRPCECRGDNLQYSSTGRQAKCANRHTTPSENVVQISDSREEDTFLVVLSLKNRSPPAAAPFRCLTPMPSEGSMKARILTSCPRSRHRGRVRTTDVPVEKDRKRMYTEGAQVPAEVTEKEYSREETAILSG
ncbi:hypothetical protein T265_08755 [Opisthorchis viverrini]|uniref:Uncharacterized protein n=1 Tax=Opisthorchis viverrini TaxID=6198 RepID=A0A074ZJ22_OPIVI|nr:hypothetical protein T265_08755 [Opisthorchis viverrini]KER23345.1 hypothetical protein T265_08755 [Opisthorchis viverrini]